MHYIRFRERESFSHKTIQTLPQCIIPALYMSCFTCFLPNWIVLVLRYDTFVDTIKVCEAFPTAIGQWPTFRSLENGFLEMNDCSFCLYYEMVTLAKKRPARRNRMKNRCCSKGSLQHERHTVTLPVDRSSVDGGKGSNSRRSSYSKKRRWGN